MAFSYLPQVVALTQQAFPQKFEVMYPTRSTAKSALFQKLNLQRTILFEHEQQLYGLLGYFYRGEGFLNLSHPALAATVAPDQFYIEALIVHPQYQRFGIASWLLQEGKKMARRYGYRLMALDVSCHNEGAISLYEKQGFQITDVNPVLPNSFDFPYFYRMVLQL